MREEPSHRNPSEDSGLSRSTGKELSASGTTLLCLGCGRIEETALDSDTCKVCGGVLICLEAAMNIARDSTKPDEVENEGELLKLYAELLADQRNTFSRFDLRELLGRGGMGFVRVAWDPQLQREVAIKFLKPPYEEDEAEYLDREILAVQKLSHPSIVRVFEWGRAEGLYYLCMELIRGRPLTAWGPPYDRRGLRNTVSVFSQVCDAVAHAHSQGVIHRDIKPLNVLVRPNLRPVLVDWGLSRPAATGGTLTSAGFAKGTRRYMAPEMYDGKKATPRTDLYSLGATLHYLLTGQDPFETVGDSDLVRAIREDAPTSPVKLWPEVPAGLASISRRCLLKDPANRYASVEALAMDLNRFLRDEFRPRLLATQLRRIKDGLYRYRSVRLGLRTAAVILMLAVPLAWVLSGDQTNKRKRAPPVFGLA